MKFCKWIIEKNNHFIELNRTSFLILWHWGAIWYIYNGYFKNIVSYLFLAGCILIFVFKISNLTQINKVINFLKKYEALIAFKIEDMILIMKQIWEKLE
ncbi:hypothetical protein [Spiroplasma endosymbiont of Nephrotoma flavescens]|uniref:hypothetical protein n=1 Tax=Spiroplasma endosymbiont of Nephrotoma flavescens TaxID=3066302 RepID=UPI00313E57D6